MENHGQPIARAADPFDERVSSRTRGSEQTAVVDGRLPRGHRQTLAEMNRPVYTARGHAAHRRAAEILLEEIRFAPGPERLGLYDTSIALVDDAITATRRSQIQLQDSPILHYLTLLREIVEACQALLRHELNLDRESRSFSETLGSDTVIGLQQANVVLSESEMKILQCIEGIVSFGRPILEQDTHERRDHFTEDDRRRYQTALREYENHYGVIESSG